MNHACCLPAYSWRVLLIANNPSLLVYSTNALFSVGGENICIILRRQEGSNLNSAARPPDVPRDRERWGGVCHHGIECENGNGTHTVAGCCGHRCASRSAHGGTLLANVLG